jgi:alanyl-tRNA synthetase
MKADDLRKKYIRFFVEKGHKLIPSSRLVPENDPTALFINSGMHPLVPYLLGEQHPLGKRLTSVQKCVRTDDINEVGDSTHLTFFEMLGNWSLGDYFKKDAINYSFEFLTNPKWLELDPQKIYVSVFEGEEGIPLDEESIKTWQEVFHKVGIRAEVGDYKKGVLDNARIFQYPRAKNWWGPAGQTGPCGPDSEMFYDTGKTHDKTFGEICHPNCSCGKYVEIWNDVFMEYNMKADKTLEQLPQKNVDTGLGLERELMILEGKESVFDTHCFFNTIAKIEEITGKNPHQTMFQRPIRIVADHLRAATFIIADGIFPSNKEQGSILRRLIRRAIRFARLLGSMELFTAQIAKVIISDYEDAYPELKENAKTIQEVLSSEEDKFSRTIDKGLKEWEKIVKNDINKISGDTAFYLYETFGFPLEMTEELAKEKNIKVDVSQFQEEFIKHQQKSREGATQKFAGGLADHSAETTKLHTATHLLQKALRTVLGGHVHQIGSNITAERLRFDFSHDKKLTDEEIQQVEHLVNEAIKSNFPVFVATKKLQQALEEGALAFFGEKYPETVKVYTIGKENNFFSKEVCGGPHVDFTGVLGRFKIKKEEASGVGKRRIYASLI